MSYVTEILFKSLGFVQNHQQPSSAVWTELDGVAMISIWRRHVDNTSIPRSLEVKRDNVCAAEFRDP